MATKRISALGWIKPDNGGDVIIEPFSILATNDVWDRLIARFGANNAAQPTLKGLLHGGFVVPKDYVSGGKFYVRWCSTLTAGDVVWGIQYRVVAAAASLDQAGTQESVSATATTSATAYAESETGLTVTSANFAADRTVEFAVFRDGAAAADTMAGSAILFELVFEYLDA